ncbi:hypothetical protein ACSSS7_004497 [Eimeria intestinalis]
MPAATKQVASLPWHPAVLRKQQVLPGGTQQDHHLQEQRGCALKMEEGGGASRRSAREGNPLLPQKEKARKNFVSLNTPAPASAARGRRAEAMLVYTIVRFIRTGAEAQDSLTAVEEQVIRFDTPGPRAEAGGRSAAALAAAGLEP